MTEGFFTPGIRLIYAENERADERTRTADLLITSDPSGLARGCKRLQMPHIWAAFSAPACLVLHCIAIPVVSEWYQKTVNHASPLLSARSRLVPKMVISAERVMAADTIGALARSNVFG